MSKDTDVMSQSVIQVWNGWAWSICGMQEGCCSYSYRIGGEKELGFCLFLAVAEDFLGGETHSKSTSRKVNQGSLHSVMFSISLFHVRDNLLILSSLYELRLFFPDFRVEPVI